MKQPRHIITAILMLLATTGALADKKPDWINHDRYAAANAEVMSSENRPVAVFIGNSITDFWYKKHPEFFTDNNYVCRGISAQVTTQMLARFRSDVIALRPEVVVILAGINDIALNNGAIELRHIADNIASMTDLARWHGITPVVCSVLPAAGFSWRPEITDAPRQIAALNAMLKKHCDDNNIIFVDYYSPMAVEGGAMDPRYSDDMVHPTVEGYSVMEPIVVKAIKYATNR